MPDFARILRRRINDPRLRILIVVALLLLIVVLAWHAVGMADHSMMMLGACLAVLVVTGVLAQPTRARTSPITLPTPCSALSTPVSAFRLGCHPPEQGVLLRL